MKKTTIAIQPPPIDVVSYQCPVTSCMKVIGGKWKPIIIYLVSNNINRFGILQRSIKGISKQMLTAQLRELEKDSILTRTVFQILPPKVEYTLTNQGHSLLPVIAAMETWGKLKLSNNN